MRMHTESAGYSTESTDMSGMKRQHFASYAKEELENWEYSTGGDYHYLKIPLNRTLYSGGKHNLRVNGSQL